MWQSTTIEEPMKPMAPMPIELPSRLSSASSAAILGSGLLDPTVRRHEACLPRIMQMSLEPPRHLGHVRRDDDQNVIDASLTKCANRVFQHREIAER